ncbi:MAG TPA: type II toxin-antitoxin system mRNA interferase toxin, RelE/StbE family [Clostridiales bacterium]|nr:type II toxin-antitoxin system mRNA interferase toxin, RelE/StbE family [Clostridiales bacterium]
MLKPRYTAQFKKDFKAIEKRGYPVSLLEDVVRVLCAEETLPAKNRDHALSGDYAGFRECHIQPDWLLIYRVEKQILTLTLTRTGTHSDLFA